jgi:uncharacterized protein (TIGR02001 family)
MKGGSRRLLVACSGLGLLLAPRSPHAAEAQTGPATPEEDAPGGTEELASTGDVTFSFGWNATFASKYLFLGVDLSDGNPVVQPEASIGIENFSATLWMNYDVGRDVANEFDFYLQYAWEFGRASIAPGYAYYRYPHREGWDPTREILVDLEYDTVLSPSLSLHHDFDAGKGTYATLGVSRELPTPVHSFTVGTNLFYQKDYYDQTGFPSWEISLGTELSNQALSIAPSLSYFHTWENGDFVESGSVPSSWLFALSVSGL